MPSPIVAPLPTWWLRVWIAIGVGAFLLIVIVPALIFTTFTSERHRYQACEQKLRNDCKPSMIWLFAGWIKPTSLVEQSVPTTTSTRDGSTGIPTTSTSTLPFQASREERTSAAAPRILSIRAGGAIMDRGVYQIVEATTTTWTVKATAAQTIEFYLKTSGGVNATSKRIVILKKQKDGSFVGTWKAPGVLGELEVRATGVKNARHSLFFAVASTP